MENQEQKNVEETTVNNQEEVKETVESTETEAVVAEETVEATPAPVVEKKERAIATFSGDIESRVYTFAELEAASEDYTDDEFNDMATMYESTLSSIDEKEIVTGRVVSIDEKYVVVDIGFKSEGIIFTNEFSAKTLETLKVGDEIEVFLDRVEDKDGQLILSRRKADILQAWEKIEAAHETEIIIDGFIKRRIKGGMVVDVYGIDAFLPGSQIDVRPVRDFDAYVGKTMEFKVVKLNMRAENVVVSHRALIESDLEEQREKILDSITPGQVLEGTVKNITDFGVFIDLGGVDGLLHITDLSWGRVENPSEIVQLDQKMNVAVIDYDQKSKRVSLGLKQLQPHPWDEIDSKYPEGGRVQGRVVSIADYGAFIELEKGIEGLIHISEMSWTQHIKHPSQLVQKDDIIECVVLSVNKDERKISLGVKQLENDPWGDIEERYPINSTHKGTIRNLTNFGVFVELEPGIDGLIHISDLSWTEKVTHPSEIVEKGQEIEAKILAIDFDNRRITLGHKQVTENPWDKYQETYAPGTEIEATVSKVTEKGIHVKLEIGIDAFIPANKMITDAAELKEGDVINATVTTLDEENKSIELSQDIKEIGKLKTAIKKAEAKKSEITGTPTLGEMSGLADLKKKMEAQEKEEEKEEE
jgi:small subunit ribosomal protein S1